MDKKPWIIVLILTVMLIAMLFGMLAFNGIGNQDTSQDELSKDENKDQYTVTFFSNDGTVLKVDSVKDGAAANPPKQPQMMYGTVFRAWDAGIYSVTKNLEIHPICEDVKGKPNIFAIEGAYGKSGGTVIVPIRLCGEVCVSAFDMTIRYDSDALDLVSVSEDGAVLYNAEVPGEIRLNYVSTDNTVADVDICFLGFSVKASSGQIPVSLEMHGIYTYRGAEESENDKLYVPEYSTVDGTVFVLPKGE